MSSYNRPLIESYYLIKQAELNKMSHDELLSLAKEFFENRPSLLHDFIIRKQGSAPEQNSQAITPPSWCKCRHCIEMPTAKERKCCQRVSCITLDRTYYEICINGINLEVAIKSRSDIYVSAPSYDNASMRHIGYQQFVMWQHGPLGAGNRVVIPSCTVWGIRRKYPSANGQYSGYKDR